VSPRIKAFVVHLAISLLLLAGILYVVVFIWYPPPFFAADGGWQGVKIMIGVDLVLGPLLTLAVYNPGKGMDRLRRDLIIIAIIQISALTAGAWVVADQRTRIVAFADSRFVSMTEIQIEESGVSEAVLETLRGQRPPMAYVRLPENEAERSRFIMSTMGGKPLFKHGDRYEPLTFENRMRIVAKGFDLSRVAQVIPELAPEIDTFLEKIGRSAEEVSALPLYCRYEVLTLVMDRASGEILDTLNITHEQLIASGSLERLQGEGKL
jgi:hypothetical protein